MRAEKTYLILGGSATDPMGTPKARALGPLEAMARHKKLAAGCFLGILLVTVLVILFYPRKYHSTAKLFLRMGRENVTLDPTASTTGETQMVMRTRESEVKTAIEMMESRDILQAVVDSIGAEVILSGVLPGGEPKSESPLSWITRPLKETISNLDPIEDVERAIVELENDFEATAPSEAGVVTVEYITDSPELAQVVVSEWVRLFQEHYVSTARTRGAFGFFEEQEALPTDELKELRNNLMEVKNRNGLVTIEGQQLLLEQQIQSVQLEKLGVDTTLAEVQTRILALERAAEKISETKITQNVSGLPNEARDQMRTLLYELEVAEKQATSYLTPNHPKLTAIREQIANATEVVEGQQDEREQVTEGINPIRQVLDEKLELERAEEKALSSKAVVLEAQRNQLSAAMTELNKHEQEVASLQRRLEILEERYKTHSQRFEQARLDQALEAEQISSINVVQKATLEYRPVTPRKKLCAILGLLAAIAAAVGFPMWIEGGESNEQMQPRVSELPEVEFNPPSSPRAEHSGSTPPQAIPR